MKIYRMALLYIEQMERYKSDKITVDRCIYNQKKIGKVLDALAYQEIEKCNKKEMRYMHLRAETERVIHCMGEIDYPKDNETEHYHFDYHSRTNQYHVTLDGKSYIIDRALKTEICHAVFYYTDIAHAGFTFLYSLANGKLNKRDFLRVKVFEKALLKTHI